MNGNISTNNKKVTHMTKIIITRVILVDSAGQKTSYKGEGVIDSSGLEDYRKLIKKTDSSVDHVLFTYEEAEKQLTEVQPVE